jgi:hypothetical protein
LTLNDKYLKYTSSILSKMIASVYNILTYTLTVSIILLSLCTFALIDFAFINNIESRAFEIIFLFVSVITLSNLLATCILFGFSFHHYEE